MMKSRAAFDSCTDTQTLAQRSWGSSTHTGPLSKGQKCSFMMEKASQHARPFQDRHTEWKLRLQFHSESTSYKLIKHSSNNDTQKTDILGTHWSLLHHHRAVQSCKGDFCNSTTYAIAFQGINPNACIRYGRQFMSAFKRYMDHPNMCQVFAGFCFSIS